MSVAFRQPTFKNPIPFVFKTISTTCMGIFMGMVALGETAGRARAAAELHRQGYHEEAKALMLELEELQDK